MGIRQLATAIVLCLAAVPASAQLASDSDRREALQHYRNGQDLLAAERFEKAIEEFQLAVTKDHLLTVAHYGIGEANMNLHRYPSAIAAFQQCTAAFRTLFDLQQRDSFRVEQLRDDEVRELRDTARRMAQRNSNDLRIVAVERRVEELERRRSVNANGFVPPAEVSLALGSAYFHNRQLQDAEREWTAAIAVNPHMGEAHNNLAALFAITGRKREAEAAVAAALTAGYHVNPQLKADIGTLEEDATIAPLPVDDIAVEALIPTISLEHVAAPAIAPVTAVRQSAIDEFDGGIKRMEAGAFDQAAAAFLRSIARDRTLSMAYYALGHAYLARARFNDAITAYARCLDVLRLEPTSAESKLEPEVWLALGSAQFLDRRLDQAEASWQKSLQLRTDLGAAWNNLAALYAQTRARTRAVEALTAARKSGIAPDPRLIAAIEGMK
jgi:tetratricopeptide (TPR) repeat protein